LSVARDPVPAGVNQVRSPVSPDSAPARPPREQRRGLFWLVLALGFVHGLLYLAVFPPWQHYDEPTHFEYMRLIAERRRLPKSGEFDLFLRQEIASSMQATGFWRGTTVPTIDFWSHVPPGIGVSELYHPPVYYALLALPQLLVAHQSVELQLYLARLCSILLYLVVLASAYGTTAEALPGHRHLPVVVTGFLALLPPFTDVMSSVNNDVGAAAAASLFVYACVRMARRGLTWRRAALCIALAAVCFAVKTTAGAVAVTVLALLAISYLPKAVWRWGALALAVLLLAGVFAAISWRGYAAGWYSESKPSAPNRLAHPTPLGRWTLALSATGDDHPRAIFQELPWSTGQALRGHTVTFGAWLRAPEGAAGLVALNLSDGLADHRLRVQATPDWQFHAFTATVGVNAPGLAAYAVLPERSDAAQTAYLDGLVLVDGVMPVQLSPTAGRGPEIDWGGAMAVNLLRNPSAERGWPGLRVWLGDRTAFREPIARVFHSVLDWRRTAWTYPQEAWVLFTSFWGSFGWNHLALPSGYLYPLAVLASLAVGGVALALVQARKSGRLRDPRTLRVLLVLAAAVLVGWGNAMVRVHPVFATKHIHWPVARYASVVIVPTALLLCAGWAQLVPRRWGRAATLAGWLVLICLDLLALGTLVLPYYYGPW
jgi:hypothetical protein